MTRMQKLRDWLWPQTQINLLQEELRRLEKEYTALKHTNKRLMAENADYCEKLRLALNFQKSIKNQYQLLWIDYQQVKDSLEYIVNAAQGRLAACIDADPPKEGGSE